MPLVECAHFGQHRTAQALYDAVVARYSSPATASLGRLLLPYLFPQLSAFATVEDLVTHLCTSDARYRAALPVEDHFLALDPTALTVDLLEQHLLAAETSVVAVGAARGTPRTPFFGGCSPSPLAPSYASSAAVDVLGAEDVAAASASGKRRSNKGKSGRGGGGGSSGGGGGSEGGGGGGSGGGSGGFGGGGGGSGGGGGGGGSGSGGGRAGATQRGGSSGGQRHAEGVCYLCVPPNPGIEAASLGASESALPGTALAEALHTFTLDSGASFTAALQDALVTTTIPGGQRVSICTCTRTGRHLTTFTCRPGSSLYNLAIEPPQVVASAQVSASSPVAPPCSCRLLSHQTLLSHHRLGHPSLPRLCGVHSRLLVSGLPRSLPPLPPSPAPPCLPCVEGQQRAAPHSSSFPSTATPLQTLQMDVWGPGLRQWTGPRALLTAVRLQLRERFRKDLPVLRLHSDRGGEFSFDLLVLLPQVDPLCGTVPVVVAVNSGAARGAVSGGAACGGAECGGAEPGGAEPGGAESEGAGSGGAEPGGAEPGGAEPASVEPWGAEPEGLEPGVPHLGGAGVTAGAASTGGAATAGPGGARSSGSGAARTGSVGGAGAGGAGAGDLAEPGGAGAGGTGVGAGETGAFGVGAGGTGIGGAGAGGAGVVDPGAGGAVSGGTGAGGIVRPRPYFVPLLQQVLGLASSTGLTPPLLSPPPDQSQPPLQPACPLPAPSLYTEQTSGLTERCEPTSRPASPVRTGHRVHHPRPPPVFGTHAMALRPSSVPLRVPLPAPLGSSLPAVPDPQSNLARAACPTVSRHLFFESTAASALVAELVDFAAACRLDYATALVVESESSSPPFVKDVSVLEDVGAASTSAKHRSSKGKGGRGGGGGSSGGGGGSGSGGGGTSGGGGGSGGGGRGGTGGGSGSSGGGGGGSGGSGGSGGGGSGGGRSGPRRGGPGGGGRSPRVSLPETTPTLRWTGKVGDASAFHVWGSRAFVRDTTADKLSSRAVPCVFLGFPPDAPGWQFYHPTSRRVLSSQDVTFDNSVSYYRLFPYRTASPPPPPLFLAPGTPLVDPLPPQGRAPSGVSQVDPVEPVEVAVDSGAARGACTAGAGPGGAETGGAESGGAEPRGVAPEGTASGGVEPVCAESGGALGVPSRREPLSPQRLHEWYSRRCR
ncbi:unnamed protein product, partial [Closterium sp. NIES-54]